MREVYDCLGCGEKGMWWTVNPDGKCPKCRGRLRKGLKLFNGEPTAWECRLCGHLIPDAELDSVLFGKKEPCPGCGERPDEWEQRCNPPDTVLVSSSEETL